MKSKILTILALFMVAIGAFGLSGILRPPEPVRTEVIDETVEAPARIQLWYAKADLIMGQEANREHLAIKSVEQADANYAGFNDDVDLDIKPGMIARLAINKGQYVTQDDFVAPDEDGFVDLTIREGFVPFPILVPPDSIIGGIISHGTDVDIIALSSAHNNLARNSEVGDSDKSLELRPILAAIPVLQVLEQEPSNNKEHKVNLILELTRNQVARLTIAKQLASLEVHKSIGEEGANKLRANSGDVLPNFRSVTEFRAEKTVVK